MAFFFLHVEVANYSHCQHSLQGHREVCILPRTTAVVHTALPSLPSMLPRSIWRCADIVIIYISTSSFIFTPTSFFFFCICWLVRAAALKLFLLQIWESKKHLNSLAILQIQASGMIKPNQDQLTLISNSLIFAFLVLIGKLEEMVIMNCQCTIVVFLQPVSKEGNTSLPVIIRCWIIHVFKGGTSTLNVILLICFLIA